MSVQLLLLVLAELLLIGGAVRFFWSSRREREREEALNVLHQYVPQQPGTMALEPFDADVDVGLNAELARLLEGLSAQRVLAYVALVAVVSALIGIRYSFWHGVFAIVTGVLLGVAILYERKRRIRRQMRLQMPLFIDLVLRSLSSGKAVEWALRSATYDAEQPLRGALDEVITAVDAGGGLAQALHRASVRHDLHEFSLFALAIHISYNYGSNPKPMLDNVAGMVRRSEQMRQELASLTGETRLSAWVLGALPVLMVIYMHFTNPRYFGDMLADDTGRIMFIVAVGLELLGVFTLWRMMRSMG